MDYIARLGCSTSWLYGVRGVPTYFMPYAYLSCGLALVVMVIP